MSRVRCIGSATTLGLLALGLAVVCGLSSARWIDTPFPGFVILKNRVIASVSLPHWPVAQQPELYQQAVVAVNGQTVRTSEELYAAVGRLPSGSPVTYTLEQNYHTRQITLPAQTFTLQDYVLLFGAYLVNGLAIALIGIGAWGCRPAAPASRALLSLGLTAGLWAMTASDLYGPHWFFRLHVLGEALFPASFIHLALVFPIDRRARWQTDYCRLAYLGAGALAIVYEAGLAHPAVYSLVHNICTLAAGLSLLFLIGKIGWDYWMTTSALIRQQIRVMLLGSLSGYSFPILLVLLSSLSGGAVAVNAAAFTAFFFPLSIGYVVVKYDLLGPNAGLQQEGSVLAAGQHGRVLSPWAARQEVKLLRRMWHRGRVFALVLMTVGLALTTGLTSLHWINTSFPGFVVLANRVIASVSLPHWSVAAQADLYQQAVVAVNGQPVQTSAALYAAVRQLPPGTAVTYTVEKEDQTSQVTLPSQTFTLKDYGLLFGVYLLNGVAFACIGLGVWGGRAVTAASRALLLVGVTLGLFALTGVDLYGPYWFFRLHVLSEAFFPATLVHLALVFPRNRLRRGHCVWLAAPYLVAGTLGIVYEVLLYHPSAYSEIHNLCMVYAGLAGLILIGSALWHYGTTTLQRIRQQIRIVSLSCLSAYGGPAALMFMSGLMGGAVAVNAAAFTAFLFPLALGVVMVKRELGGVETVLKRALYALTLLALVAFAYGVLGGDIWASIPALGTNG